MEGEVIISSSRDQSIFVWEPQSLTVLSTFIDNTASSKNSLVYTNNSLVSAQSSKPILNYYIFGKESPDKKSSVLEEISCLSCYLSLLLGGSIHGNLFLWDLTTGSLLCTWQSHLQKVTNLHLDDWLISTSDDASLKIFRTSLVLEGNFSVYKQINTNLLPITGIVKRGSCLFTCSADKSLCVFRNWELASQNFFSQELNCLDVNSLNEVVLGTVTGQLIIQGKQLEIEKKAIEQVKYTIDERFLIVAAQKVHVVNLQGEVVKTFVLHLAEVVNILCVGRPKDFGETSGVSRSSKVMKRVVEGEPGAINYEFTRTEELAKKQEEKPAEETGKLKEMNSILFKLWAEHCA